MHSNIIPFPRRQVTPPIETALPFAAWQLWIALSLVMFAMFCEADRRARP